MMIRRSSTQKLQSFITFLFVFIGRQQYYGSVNAWSPILVSTQKTRGSWIRSNTIVETSRCFSSTTTTDEPTADDNTYTLVLVRHGESTWNKENLFTGWADVPLSEEGEQEAHEGGQLLRDGGFQFDVAYTSFLKRAIKTLWIILEEMDLMYLPIVHTWRLNERHYGALQGLNKQETVDKYGKDQVLIWRRSYDIPPPALDTSSEHYPGNDPKYAGIPSEDLPLTESLALTEERFMVDWHQNLVPEITSGKRLLIAAHGNTLRALVKHLDDIPPEDITGLNIPTGVPLVYELDATTLKPIPHPDAIPPLTGRYLGNQEDIRNRIGAVMAQTK